MSNTDKEALRQAAELARKQVDETAAESVARIKEINQRLNRERYGCDCDRAECYKTCPRYLTHCEPEQLFDWWGKTSPPDRRETEPILHIPAPPAKKGGSKSGKRRRNKKVSDLRLWTIS